MKPLGTELRNVVCSRLGNRLYLEIQKGEGGDEGIGFSTENWRYDCLHGYYHEG